MKRKWIPLIAGCSFGLIVGLVSLLVGAVSVEGPAPGTEILMMLCFPVIPLVLAVGHILPAVLAPLLYVLFPVLTGVLYGGITHLVSVAVRKRS
jgi:hypothetical protein